MQLYIFASSPRPRVKKFNDAEVFDVLKTILHYCDDDDFGK